MTSSLISACDIVRVEAIINSLCICMEGPGGEDQAAARVRAAARMHSVRAQRSGRCQDAQCEGPVSNKPASEQKSEI